MHIVVAPRTCCQSNGWRFDIRKQRDESLRARITAAGKGRIVVRRRSAIDVYVCIESWREVESHAVGSSRGSRFGFWGAVTARVYDYVVVV
tara:strand:- start:1044 stop:1316 length:273 start_codon:yes stop_codon:yes gene_type:complete